MKILLLAVMFATVAMTAPLSAAETTTDKEKPCPCGEKCHCGKGDKCDCPHKK